jgi:hypothetical protein
MRDSVPEATPNVHSMVTSLGGTAFQLENPAELLNTFLVSMVMSDAFINVKKNIVRE